MQWVQIQGKILYIYIHSGVIYTSGVRLKLKAALKSSKKNVCSLGKQGFGLYWNEPGDKLSTYVFFDTNWQLPPPPLFPFRTDVVIQIQIL